MPKYTVICEGALEVGRKDYPRGSVVELSESVAAKLPPGTVAIAKEPAKEPAKDAGKEKKP